MTDDELLAKLARQRVGGPGFEILRDYLRQMPQPFEPGLEALRKKHVERGCKEPTCGVCAAAEPTIPSNATTEFLREAFVAIIRGAAPEQALKLRAGPGQPKRSFTANVKRYAQRAHELGPIFDFIADHIAKETRLARGTRGWPRPPRGAQARALAAAREKFRKCPDDLDRLWRQFRDAHECIRAVTSAPRSPRVIPPE